jgi:hypothetical protein
MNHVRHQNIYTIPYYTQVAIIGAGGIGSITAVTLAKMGVNFIHLWDADTVGTENIPTQLHPVSNVGKYKAVSTAELIYQFSDEARVMVNTERFTADSVVKSHIVISAVDTIRARQDIWDAVLHSPSVQWYIDARMSAEQFQMYVVNLSGYAAREHYDRELMGLKEDDVPEVPCTMKATFFTACIAAGHAGAAIRRIVTDENKSYRVVHYIPQNTLYEFNL